ncbi:MAG: hypothetical protein KTR30_26835 [Saprospiraceae bacterium]|nr:hypothetical protein [Saprospiraceae bacterium]
MNREERLMAYLYGEMEAEEKLAFEKEIEGDPELRAELGEFQETQFCLQELPDLQPEATVLSLGGASNFDWRKWGLRLGVAASFLLLLGLTNARMEFSEGSFVIAFGKERVIQDRGESKAAIAQQATEFKAALLEKERVLNQKLVAMDSLWQNQLAANSEAQQLAIAQQWQRFQAKRQADFAALQTQFKEEQLPQFAALLQNMQVAQKQELQDIISGLYTDWEETRILDLKAIETEFVHLYKNVERNHTETAAVLDDIVNGNFLN